MSYFRLHDEGSDPLELLEQANQWSEPWGEQAVPRPCDKCGGSGRTEFHCLSCEDAPDGSCEACRGEVRYTDKCPACKGGGTITDDRRPGVSVFPDERGLLAYMCRRDADLDSCVLVELEGEPADEVDFDADEGALLVHPTRIVRVGDAEPSDVDAAKRRVARERAGGA